MRKEIVNLLTKNQISDKTIEELSNVKLDELLDSVKELGIQETEYIKRDEILEKLNTKFVGNDIYVFNEVMSTNTIAKFLANNDSADGTVILSEKQTKAKGRSGNEWHAPIGGIWMSIVLRPHIGYSKLPIITLATGVALTKTLRKFGVDAKIKWPNDVLINRKKACGILTEAIANFNTVESVIIGIGINANMDLNSFPDYLKENSTTVSEELGHDIDVNELIADFLEEFEKICLKFRNEDFEEILNEWRINADSIGRYVTVKEPLGKTVEGYVVGINKEGALIIEKADESFEKIISGQCIFKE